MDLSVKRQRLAIPSAPAPPVSPPASPLSSPLPSHTPPTSTPVDLTTKAPTTLLLQPHQTIPFPRLSIPSRPSHLTRPCSTPIPRPQPPPMFLCHFPTVSFYGKCKHK
ncbi:hypothetical protein Pcinc_043824 [Petrolisthes cinctipes]|uniref:Uncharacterized protein n=1 Tax=Petrolisthes cinctipes TaxID=88211 RepID=A0AAE1BES7_PETCI|nr:hypothetical protein Pcinc_043824 [Petrolisthes cinctipes]